MTTNRYQGVTEETPRGDWMQTYTGRAFYPADPKPQDIFIEDIAHALSMQCRYGGHCDDHYSVAEHSYIVSTMVPREDALAALLHDATEAYLVDVPRPVKVLLPQYRDLEATLWAAICARFGLSKTLPDSVHEADNRILLSERDANMLPPPMDWGIPDDGTRVKIHLWPAKIAESAFFHRFYELGGGEL